MIFSSIILGIIQGIAEFLPISSSAHLIIFRDLFGIGQGMSQSLALTFDIALHFGTLLAIGVFFFKDFIDMFRYGFTKGVKHEKGKILWYIIAATIPAGIVGVLFEEPIENFIRSSYVLIALALVVMGIVLYIVDKNAKEDNSIKKMSLKNALVIGCSQVFALIPGFSRSGTTITAARASGMKREDAAKFSFYLSAPVVLGATVIHLFKDNTMALIGENAIMFIVGVLVSFIIGMICIKFLLKFLKKNDFKLFMIYRIILAAIVILTVIIK